MVNTFIDNYFNALMKMDFNTMLGNKIFIIEELNDTTKHAVISKIYGPNLYKVVLSNGDKIDLQNYCEIIENNTKKIEACRDKIGIKNIYNIHIIVTDNEKQEVKEVLSKAKAIEESFCHDIFWSVNINKKDFKFDFNKNQPSEIIGIKKILIKVAKETKKNNVEEVYKKDTQDENVIDIKRIEEVLKHKILEEHRDFTPNMCMLIFLINMMMLILLIRTGGSRNVSNLLRFGAMHPTRIIQHGEYYRLITSFFLHAGVLHFISNSLGLYIFGVRIEKYMGPIKFIVIYMVSGLVSSMFSLAFTRGISVGSSGAVYGLMGAVCIRSYILNKNMDGLSYYTVLIFILIGIGVGMGASSVDNFGHIGGLLAGLTLGYIFTKLQKSGY
jgi:membrane associated rhomboid family serine protease